MENEECLNWRLCDSKTFMVGYSQVVVTNWMWRMREQSKPSISLRRRFCEAWYVLVPVENSPGIWRWEEFNTVSYIFRVTWLWILEWRGRTLDFSSGNNLLVHEFQPYAGFMLAVQIFSLSFSLPCPLSLFVWNK